MSIESAKSYIERLQKDTEFAKKMSSVNTAEARITLAHEEGFDFTPEEITQLTSELTDDDLDSIAAGVTLIFPPCVGFGTNKNNPNEYRPG